MMSQESLHIFQLVKIKIPYNQGWPGNTGGRNSQWQVLVITVPGNTPNFVKVGNTGKYVSLVLFLLQFSVMFV